MTIEQRLTRIERTLLRMVKNQEKQPENWISEADAETLTGYSKKTLQVYRRTGKIKKWKSTDTGRKIRYDKNELETLIIKA